MVYRTAPFPNPDFKVRPFFDAEYLQNGCRYGHSYYGKRIGNLTRLSNGTTFNTNTNTNTIKTYKAPLYKTGQERYKSTVSGYMHEQKVQFSV